jgi:hypothetical protein
MGASMSIYLSQKAILGFGFIPYRMDLSKINEIFVPRFSHDTFVCLNKKESAAFFSVSSNLVW